MRTRLVTSCLIVLLSVTATWAQSPLGSAFTYQGQLKDAGSPAAGQHDLRFQLFNASSLGAQIGTTQCADNVNVAEGLFTVPLDFGAAAFNGDERWLEIGVRADNTVGNCAGGVYTTITPRLPLTATPYALQTRGIFVDNAGKVGIGIGAPIARLHVQSASSSGAVVFGLSTGGAGNTYGAFFQSNSTDGIGVLGSANATTGSAYGVYGQSLSESGRGVSGFATATSGTTFGLYGESTSTTGRGVYGEATAASGFTYGGRFQSASTLGRGVYGEATASTGETYGGRFHSASIAGRGVYGVASATSGATYGVWGQSASSSGRGIYGEATAANGSSVGVYGESDSSSGFPAAGIGVYGEATAASGFTYGGQFRSNSPNGTGVSGIGGSHGVYGESLSGHGVLGYASSISGTNYGVYGASSSSSSTAYGVYASGNLGASGSKSFRIDHPDDPANKYLLHYAAESPEVINFYSETVTLDDRGEAVVELPHYFAKINTRPRYQLTAVGAPMPMLHVAAEIDAAALIAGAKAEPGETAPLCSFRIAGGAPGAKVSWEVKAVRNDRWVQKRGAPVEVEKQGLEKGTYQHPGLYGQPPEKGMSYDAERTRPSLHVVSDATSHP